MARMASMLRAREVRAAWGASSRQGRATWGEWLHWEVVGLEDHL